MQEPKFFTTEQVSFVTDIEGNLDYFLRWVKRSSVVDFDSDGKLVFRTKNSMFVFGGDATDKRNGDLRILRLLVDFKKRYGNRVILIAGNRDINKIRFTQELDKKLIKERFKEAIPVNPLLRPKKSAPQYLKDQGKEFDGMSIEESQIAYLKWMLQESMGCGPRGANPGTFELRRQELALLAEKEITEINDKEVLNSFLTSVQKGGIVREYLQLTQIGAIIKDTLFVHGAVTQTNMGKKPVREWLANINDWYRQEIASWVKEPTYEKSHAVAYGSLNKYALSHPETVVCASWYDSKMLPIPVAKEVVSYLNEGGIKRVITGHQPFGDSPLILRTDNLMVYNGDTSYSDMSKHDNRGAAIHNLTLVYNSDGSTVLIKGVRKTGYEYNINEAQHPEIGRQYEAGWWIGLKLSSEKCVLRTQLSNYSIPEKLIALEDKEVRQYVVK